MKILKNKLTKQDIHRIFKIVRKGILDMIVGCISTMACLKVVIYMNIEHSLFVLVPAILLGGSMPLIIESVRLSPSIWYAKLLMYGKLGIKNELTDLLSMYPPGSHARVVNDGDRSVDFLYKDRYDEEGNIEKSFSDTTVFNEGDESLEVEIVRIALTREKNRMSKKLSVVIKWTDTYPLMRRINFVAGISTDHLANDKDWNLMRGKRLSKNLGI